MFILSRQSSQFCRIEPHAYRSGLGRQITTENGRSRVNQEKDMQTRHLFDEYTVSCSQKEESIEKQTENRFYNLAKSGLVTRELREKNRKIAESQMQIFPNLTIYRPWFIPITKFQDIISARNTLKTMAQDELDDQGNSTCWGKQINSLLNCVHPELEELFKGDQETNFQTQEVLFDEYDYTYKLNDGVFANLRLYMRVYYPDDYKRLFFECKTIETLNKAMMDFVRDRTRG